MDFSFEIRNSSNTEYFVLQMQTHSPNLTKRRSSSQDDGRTTPALRQFLHCNKMSPLACPCSWRCASGGAEEKGATCNSVTFASRARLLHSSPTSQHIYLISTVRIKCEKIIHVLSSQDTNREEIAPHESRAYGTIRG